MEQDAELQVINPEDQNDEEYDSEYDDEDEEEEDEEPKGLVIIKPREVVGNKMQFLVKTYLFLILQMTLAAAFIIYSQQWLQTYFYNSIVEGGNSVLFAVFILTVVLNATCMVLLYCYPDMAKYPPLNNYIIALFMLTLTYIVGYITIYFGPMNVLLINLLFLSMTIVIFIYSYICKAEYDLRKASYWVLGWTLVALPVLFFYVTTSVFSTLTILLSVAATIIFGFYLVLETQVLIEGQTYELTFDDYAMGSMAYYIDVIIYFLRVYDMLLLLRRYED